MPRISAERLFKQSFPKATIERRTTNGGERYFLVREERGAYMPCGDGNTRIAAWRDACDRKGLTDDKTKKAPQ